MVDTMEHDTALQHLISAMPACGNSVAPGRLDSEDQLVPAPKLARPHYERLRAHTQHDEGEARVAGEAQDGQYACVATGEINSILAYLHVAHNTSVELGYTIIHHSILVLTEGSRRAN